MTSNNEQWWNFDASKEPIKFREANQVRFERIISERFDDVYKCIQFALDRIENLEKELQVTQDVLRRKKKTRRSFGEIGEGYQYYEE